MNIYIYVSYYPKGNNKPYILVKDLTDHANEPTAYTRKIRGIEKAWAFITATFANEQLKNDLKMRDICKILDDQFHLSTHYYCAVD